MADFDLQGLLSQFNQGPSDDEKRRALTQALASAGFGILGARGVNGMQAIGQGGLLGMNAYNGALDDASKSRRAALSDANSAMGLQENMQKMQDADTLRKLQGQFAAQFGAPGANAGQAPVQPPQIGGGPSLMQSALGGAPAVPPQAAPQAAPQTGVPDKRSLAATYQKQGDWWMQNGQPAKAQAFYDLAQKAIPQIKETRPSTVNGQRVLVNFYNDGSHEIVPDVGPDKEKLNFQNTGGAIVGLDPYSGAQQGGGIPTSVSPDSQLSANTTMRGQNMTDARAREFNANAAANGGQVVETATGFARIGKDNTVTPITANGQQIQAKPTGTIQQQIATNNVTLQKIDRATALIDKYPDAFGMKNIVGDPIMQRLDPQGVAARSIVADIAGQKIHDRSGGAVSAGESERLKPYVPNVTDNPDVVKTKLANFKREYQQMQKELAGGASVAQVAGRPPSGATAGWTVQRVN